MSVADKCKWEEWEWEELVANNLLWPNKIPKKESKILCRAKSKLSDTITQALTISFLENIFLK